MAPLLSVIRPLTLAGKDLDSVRKANFLHVCIVSETDSDKKHKRV